MERRREKLKEKKREDRNEYMDIGFEGVGVGGW